jgi:hypothetical protein
MPVYLKIREKTTLQTDQRLTVAIKLVETGAKPVIHDS